VNLRTWLGQSSDADRPGTAGGVASCPPFAPASPAPGRDTCAGRRSSLPALLPCRTTHLNQPHQPSPTAPRSARNRVGKPASQRDALRGPVAAPNGCRGMSRCGVPARRRGTGRAAWELARASRGTRWIPQGLGAPIAQLEDERDCRYRGRLPLGNSQSRIPGDAVVPGLRAPNGR